MFELDSQILRNPDVVFRDLEEGGVLLHLRTGHYYNVNATGRLIWQSLDQQPTLERVIKDVRQQIPDAPADLATDVPEFIASLVERDLLQLVEKAPS